MTTTVKISDEYNEELEELQESLPGRPSKKSLVETGIEELGSKFSEVVEQ